MERLDLGGAQRAAVDANVVDLSPQKVVEGAVVAGRDGGDSGLVGTIPGRELLGAGVDAKGEVVIGSPHIPVRNHVAEPVDGGGTNPRRHGGEFPRCSGERGCPSRATDPATVPIDSRRPAVNRRSDSELGS